MWNLTRWQETGCNVLRSDLPNARSSKRSDSVNLIWPLSIFSFGPTLSG
jgi:hypothetical protein